jgi:hypothetical protein
VGELFSQQFCTVAPVGAGGRIVTGGKIEPCLVRVADGTLTIIQAPAVPVAEASASTLAIVTPPVIRRIGTAAVIRIDGRLLSVAFDMVHSRQGGGGMFSAVTGVRKGMRLGRDLTAAFTSALRAAGAADETARHA